MGLRRFQCAQRWRRRRPHPRSRPHQAELGARWRAIIIEAKCWRNPDLTMATLARRLGTNTTALSRAMNEGLGLNFNEVITGSGSTP